MATDTAKSVERIRAIYAQLLKQLGPTEREKHLARHAEDIQSAIDRVLATLSGDSQPTSVRQPRERVSAPPVPPGLASAPVERSAPCTRIHEAVEHADSATIPGAIRAVLATEHDGLSTRAVIEGVKILRPDVEAGSVHGALHHMRKRGEIAREGFHKNYKYRLTASITGLGSGVVLPFAANDGSRGGASH